MRFGVCGGISRDQLTMIREAGYDYVEWPLCDVAALSPEEVAALSADTAKAGIRPEVCNLFFRLPEAALTGETVDFEGLETYMHRAFGNAKALGCEITVIGSGRARFIPEGRDRAEAEAQMERVLALAAGVGAEYGILVVLEPLRYEETNYANTVAEGAAICRRIGHPNLRLLVDFYHVFMTGEGLDGVMKNGDLLCHAHLARSNPDRKMPLSEEDRPALTEWAAALTAAGYSGRLSLEGNYGSDMADTVKRMREVLRVFE